MKTLTLLTLITVLVGTSGFLIKVPTVPTQARTVPVGWVHLQKLILPLFENVCEDSTNPIVIRLAQEFSLDSSSGVYLKPEVIVNLQNLKSGKGLLAKGEIFTEYNTEYINELQIIYEVFVNAKDFDTFYKAAAWARQNVNCGLFVDAIYLAILNRRDTEKLLVPAPYELLPNYFIRKDVIIKASSLLSGEEFVPSDNVRVVGNAYILDANYTANFFDNEAESKLAYFHEDVGLNSFYFLQKLKRAPWFNTPQDMSVRYGEYLYHTMKQLAARYNLERYSNGLSELESINFDSVAGTPYDPMLVYSNGNEFGQGPVSSEISSNADVQFLQNIESNIATVVSHMRGTGYNKTQILNHLMEILVTGERSYENIARKLISKDVSSTNSQPSALEHYMTSLRDPVFWKLNKHIVDLVDDALKVIPSYPRNELFFPGIEVLNIDVKKMTTAFDYFQFDVTDALKMATSNTTFQVNIGQPRLNHKPFAVKLNISSLVTQKGLVKIYLGPKIAPGELASKKNLFMLIDSFEYNFKIGGNVITRASEVMTNLSEDFISIRSLRKKVEDAEFGLDALPLNNIESVTGFPSRLILPKGTPEGLPLQMFVFVAPYVKSTVGGLYFTASMEFNSAILSPGYPLDLDNLDTQLFQLPNVMVKDFIVTHKGDNKVSNYGGDGATKKWQSSGTYDPSSRPDYSSKNLKGNFDYNSKKEQYGYGSKKGQYDYGSKTGQYDKKEYYSAKKDNYNTVNEDTIYQIQNTAESSERNNGKFLEKDEMERNTIEDSNLDTDVPPKEVKKDIEQHSSIVIPENRLFLRQTSPMQRTPTVYDYLFHKVDYYDDDDVDEKVYE